MTHEHYWGCGHWGWGMGWGMWLIPLLIILAVYFLVRNNLRTKSGQSAGTPIEILKKRFAKGEITKEEYEEMKKTIGG